MRDIAPPIALIAGGRPSQAAPLEAQGTATYLHVPSPGLLDMFLRDGARRFVFEGSECGGHVGPRTGFALWETQIARLLEHPVPAELSVLFAGGIHDARSAAMIAAMAAPLAAKGARIGVLMGTAYLFTHEAVASGAIEPAFQQEAIACERTVLLETSPGHATRCADTAFADAFAVEKQRLTADGMSSKDMWAQLEQLNLGRLRIAAKGLRRDGDRIEPVDAPTQQREGMYMIGQVAALRRGTCSVEELHHDVSAGGAALLERDDERPAAQTDVAIVGLAAIFPGAPDTDSFWANILAGKNADPRGPQPRTHKDIATYYDPTAVTGQRRERRQEDAVQVGRIPRRHRVRSARLRHPAEVAHGDRARPAAIARDRGAGARRRRLRDEVVRSLAYGGDLRRRGRHRSVERVQLPRDVPAVRGPAARRARRRAAVAVGGLVPGRAVERDRRPHREPARPRRRQLHRRRRVRRIPRRRGHGGQGADERRVRHGAVRRRRPAQQHQRLPVVRERARAVRVGPVPHVRRRRRRHRPWRGRRVRRAQAARRRRARRRSRLRGAQGRRRRERRQEPRSDRAAQGRSGPRARSRVSHRRASRPRRSASSKRTAPAPSSATRPSSRP